MIERKRIRDLRETGELADYGDLGDTMRHVREAEDLLDVEYGDEAPDEWGGRPEPPVMAEVDADGCRV